MFLCTYKSLTSSLLKPFYQRRVLYASRIVPLFSNLNQQLNYYHNNDQEQKVKIALIQGASRGLGLEYVKQLLQRPSTRVIATCRSPNSADDLQNLVAQYQDRLEVLQLDVTQPNTIQAAHNLVSSKYTHLDILINVTGILHVQGKYMPETSISRIDPEFINLSFQTNAIGPILVCKAFANLLSKAEKENGATDERPAVCVNMSARVGSIQDNGLGGWYSYRASKAALNQLTKTMAIEFGRKYKIASIALHPGTCDTDLTKPFQKNVQPEKLFTRERGIQQLLGIIDNLSMKDNGRYIAWDGSDIPW
eukprot:TRINITY_DN16466_c2_g4_i1.p1 TRINITY_DN16466_c2_g4~~TRINITY_DN16466_c2_g4_i1.p1  ORF type:complete len:307 (+),score=14.42 TRINITY_DN16466_c2_g4_i1:88-1008(+)